MMPAPDSKITASPSAFGRLARLLDGISAPDGVAPVLMHMGELKAEPPSELLAPLRAQQGWELYPPLGGTPQLRNAYSGWLQRRFRLEGSVAVGIEPSAGTKHAVNALISLAVRARGSALDGRPSLVAVPNPFYPTYESAVFESGGRPAYFDSAPSQVLESLQSALATAGEQLAAIVLCHPCSPSGEVYEANTLVAIAAQARAHGVPLLVDECYIDSYVGSPPLGVLELVPRGQLALVGLIVMHTLSKRSAAPGLRSGFIAGDPTWVERFARFNRTCGVGSAWPICHAAEQLWSNDAHVETLQQQLRANWNIADLILGDTPGYARPATGFYLWLPVASDEDIAKRAWSEAGVKVMPGTYLSALSANPAGRSRHIRAALVHSPEVTEVALKRLKAVLPHAPSTPDPSSDAVRTAPAEVAVATH